MGVFAELFPPMSVSIEAGLIMRIRGVELSDGAAVLQDWLIKFTDPNAEPTAIDDRLDHAAG